MAVAITRKQKRERDEILKQINDYAKAESKEGLQNPCDIPSNLKYPNTKKACSDLIKREEKKIDLAQKSAEALTAKQTAAALAETTSQPKTDAPTTPAPTEDYTWYYVGGAALVLATVGLVFFLLKRPAAPTK